MSDSEAREREFWQKFVICLEAKAQVIQTYKLDPPATPGRVFGPTDRPPKEERQFWEGMRRNILSQVAVIKTDKIGGSAGVRLKPNRRRRPPRIDQRPEKR